MTTHDDLIRRLLEYSHRGMTVAENAEITERSTVVHEANEELSVALVKAEADRDEGKREADRLATLLWESHYKDTAPGWKLLDTVSGVISQIDNMIAGIIAERDELRKEVERLRRNTERFPDLMARIIEAKDEPLNPRIDRLITAMSKLSGYMHQYQWEADERQMFGDKWVRSVCGNNGLGMGGQAIAACPQHIDGLAEYIAAANPDTVAMLISGLLEAQALAAAIERTTIERMKIALCSVKVHPDGYYLRYGAVYSNCLDAVHDAICTLSTTADQSALDRIVDERTKELREALEEAADWVESAPEVNARRIASHIRQLAEKEQG